MNKNELLGIIPSFLVGPLLVWGLTAQINYDELKSKVQSAKTSTVQQKPQIDYVNAIRAENGVAPVTYDVGLEKASEARVDDMIARKYWEHTDPDGKPFYSSVVKVRPGLRLLGENIGRCFNTYEDLYTAYKKSPTHFKTIIDPRFTLFGSSTKWSEDSKCFINSNEFGG